MFNKAVILILAVLAFLGLIEATNTPIIGLVSQPSYDDVFPNRQYIAASYVKWIESAGGRVVPIPYNMPRHLAAPLMNQLNGLVFPGGGTEITDSALTLFEIAVEINKNGNHFPVWGTCMGFQWMSMYFAQNTTLLTNYDSYNVSYHLDFEPEASKTKFFKYVIMLFMQLNPQFFEICMIMLISYVS